MKIDGNLIAQEIKEKLKKQVVALRSKNILPHLAVILVGNDPSSLIYIRRKKIFAEEIGVKISIYKDKLLNLVQRLNKDESVHGIIIQRPVPLDIKKDELDRLVIPEKDVDGFHPESPFTPPITSAVLKILEFIFQYQRSQTHAIAWICDRKDYKENFYKWLRKKRILIIGRGETAGKPIAKTFQKTGIPFLVAHSQTTNLKKLCLSSDIIISCVGKSNVVRPQMVTNKTIVIGVGLHGEDDKLKLPQPYGRGISQGASSELKSAEAENNSASRDLIRLSRREFRVGGLRADYNQKEIAQKAAFYTPVPGGVGPVNVACLFENLLRVRKKINYTN